MPNNIEIKIFELAPSKGITPEIIKQHFNWRKTNKCLIENTIGIGDVKEPIWWNRPYQSDTIIKQEPDGLYSYNLPYIYRRNDYKTGYNLLVNKNSIPLMILIRVEPNWGFRQHAILDNSFSNTAIYKALLDLGVDKTKLKLVNNDIIYDNKKFVGTESAIYGGWFGSASVITLKFNEEKEIFERLTGKYKGHRNICGIQEETGNIFTKEQFLERLKIRLQEQADRLLK